MSLKHQQLFVFFFFFLSLYFLYFSPPSVIVYPSFISLFPFPLRSPVPRESYTAASTTTEAARQPPRQTKASPSHQNNTKAGLEKSLVQGTMRHHFLQLPGMFCIVLHPNGTPPPAGDLIRGSYKPPRSWNARDAFLRSASPQASF